MAKLQEHRCQRLGRYIRMGLHEGSQTGGNPRDDHHRNRSHHKRREGPMEIVENLVKTTLGEVEKALSTKTVVGEPITIGDATLILITNFQRSEGTDFESMEKTEITINDPIVLDGLTIIPVVSLSLNCWHFDNFTSVCGVKNLMAFLVISPAERRAYGASFRFRALRARQSPWLTRSAGVVGRARRPDTGPHRAPWPCAPGVG